MTAPLPHELADGETLSLHWLIRGLVPLAGLVLVAPALFALQRGSMSRAEVVMALLGLAMAAVWWVLSGRFHLVIDDTGVRRRSPFGDRALRWDQIADYRFKAEQHHAMDGALVAMAAAQLSSGTIVLRPHAGRALSVGSAWRDAARAVERVARRVDDAKRREIAPRMRRGEPVTFGRVTIERDGLACGDKPLLPWSEVKKVEIAFGNLLVNSSQWRRPHFGVRTKLIPHFFLLLELLEERGVRIVR